MIPANQPPPKQVTYPVFSFGVQETPDGAGLVLVINAPGETLILPFSKETAQELGKLLTAPRIIRAPANGAKL